MENRGSTLRRRKYMIEAAAQLYRAGSGIHIANIYSGGRQVLVATIEETHKPVYAKDETGNLSLSSASRMKIFWQHLYTPYGNRATAPWRTDPLHRT